MGQWCCMYINEAEKTSADLEQEHPQEEALTFTTEEQKQFEE